MKRPYLYHLPLFCLSLAFTFPAVNAQEVPENWISASVSAISLDTSVEDLKILTNGEIQDLNIYSTTRSKVVSYKGPPQLTLFRIGDAPSPEAPPVRIPVGTVTLDGLHPRYLLFLSRKAGDSEQYAIFAIPDSLDDFKAGTYRFLNLAPYNVAIKIGETRSLLAEKNITDVAGNFKHGNYYQTIILSLPDGEPNPVAAYSGRIYFNKHIRMLYILRPITTGPVGKVQFTAIPDRIRTVSAPEPTKAD